MSKKSKTQDEQHRKQQKEIEKDTTPDWTQCCDNCGQSPIVPVAGLCGPCTFGEADTMGGNW